MARIASKTVGADAVTFAFANGQEVVAVLDELPNDIVRRLALHGLSQKVGDSYAGAESVTEAAAMAANVVSNLVAGLWAAKAARGGKIVEAIHRALGVSLEDALAKWSVMDDGAKKAVKAHPDIKRALAEIEAERAAALAGAASGDAEDLGALFD